MVLPYSTRDSRIVPNCSTDRAQRCLTSQFGWDAVLSSWYDRKTSLPVDGPTYRVRFRTHPSFYIVHMLPRGFESMLNNLFILF